ncbi:MAG TPA: isoprenylcysteine carboxylmethyltransferase family protein [Thermoanaerobaculia bacterium]|nr:isoprenylcysteine carboxylmethyltransferase family protein [Thermoanaerobaculia bacterium]
MSRLRHLIGVPPIHPLPFAAAKLAIVASWAFGFFGLAAGWPFGLREIAGAVLLAAGIALVLVATVDLGAALRMGLPAEKTELETGGLYRFSRNPIYVGVDLSVIGSAIIAPSVWNLIAAVTAIVIHHFIILSEERFLGTRFGAAWEHYRTAVPRYLGPGTRIKS